MPPAPWRSGKFGILSSTQSSVLSTTRFPEAVMPDEYSAYGRMLNSCAIFAELDAAPSSTFVDDLIGLVKASIEMRMATLSKLPERSPGWSAEATAIAGQVPCHLPIRSYVLLSRRRSATKWPCSRPFDVTRPQPGVIFGLPVIHPDQENLEFLAISVRDR